MTNLLTILAGGPNYGVHYNYKDQKVYNVLLDLLQQDEVAGHAIVALGKYGDPRAIPYIEPFLSSKNAWLRREAKKAIALIN